MIVFFLRASPRPPPFPFSRGTRARAALRPGPGGVVVVTKSVKRVSGSPSPFHTLDFLSQQQKPQQQRNAPKARCVVIKEE